MYYSSGNYEAFSKTRRPNNIEKKKVHIVGAGLAGLSVACFLLRDAHMSGENINIYEKSDILGGACDGYAYKNMGFTMRGGREMDNHFECMWDLYRSIPSIENDNISVLDEYYWLNKKDPNFSLIRATVDRGKDANMNGKFKLSEKAKMEIMNLFFMKDENLYDKSISGFFSNEIFESNFWLYWRTMFAFENWHSALEVKRYLKRYIHHIGGLPDFTALRFTRYNQYESLILPIIKYLNNNNVQIHYSSTIKDIKFNISNESKIAEQMIVSKNGNQYTLDLSLDDYIFITNGSCVENSAFGSQNEPPQYDSNIKNDGLWSLWENIARQSPDFGNPKKFSGDVEKTNWVSATITTLDSKIPEYVKRISRRNPFSGETVTGGIVTIKDSNWLLSWTFNRQPQFKKQSKNQTVGWLYGLFSDIEGNFIKKRMRDCTGKEICMEWLYHLGVPINDIENFAENSANTVPCMMPYITSFFMPRRKSDRPLGIHDSYMNFAFIGQFAETERDTVFTTEYSIRTAMEAVYKLFNVDRGVPEVWGSTYDLRDLINAVVKISDGKTLYEMELLPEQKMVMDLVLNKVKDTDIEALLKEYGAI